MTIFLIIYGLIGLGLISVSRIDNDNSAWSSPALVFFILFLWPIMIIFVWSQVKVIKWHGKELWRRK